MEKRKIVIAANWKMNTNLDEAVELASEMLFELSEIDSVETILCPPFISLQKLKELFTDTRIKLGAQNVFYEEKGAFTGEISALMLHDLCQYVIIGHSERRQYFCETDEIVQKKLASAVNLGIKPIFCVGENLEQYQSEQTEEVIITQLTRGLSGLKLPDILIAYEPIWAIGTGQAASAVEANEVASLIRRTFGELFGLDAAGVLPVLYGGSVNADNIAEYVSKTDIDGALVGGASLKSSQFVSIIKRVAL
ncbi:MAG: triose-phosphate isomerase [Dehalogenimonas sp.]|jgi:triosephosphate isomerase|uniref:Triosephosphate isomerase n=1 Tax=Candidatus Dehalogenimonas loeffleri TaxID=3127115 RepID=A0ABZ2J8Y0_9CHLR|nr:triose-phosphate isomerase [Dehalogenimonas sp.]